MNNLDSSLSFFAEVLAAGKTVVCDNKHQKWDAYPSWAKAVYQALGYEEQRVTNVAKTLSKYLDRLEKQPVHFNMGNPQSQNELYQACFKASKVIKQMLKGVDSPAAKNQLSQLAQRVSALKYRIEGANGGRDRSVVDSEMYAALIKLAAAWKQRQHLMVVKTLTDRDLQRIEEACSYSKFAKMLHIDKRLQEAFFNWSLKDNMLVSQFVQFPATCARIRSAFLAARLGRLGNHMFRMEKCPVVGKENELEKVVSLPFYLDHKVTYVNILDESKELTLRNEWHLTIKKILDIFAYKNRAIGDLEFFTTRGIDVWNCHELGSWNPAANVYDRIDLSVDNWYESLPVLEEVDKSVLEARYDIKLSAGEWLACGKASRQSHDLDLDAMHGFLEVAIPIGCDRYSVYPFGNFAAIFPHTTVDLMKFLGDTRMGKISYPDENVFYSHRQIASYPLALTEEKGKRLMKKIQGDLIRARFGHIVFQFAGDNCAYWAQKTLDSIDAGVPNLYKMKLRQTKPHNLVLSKVFTMIRHAPEWMQPFLFQGVYYAFGHSRGFTVLQDGKRVFKSYKNSECCKEIAIYHPGYLHEQILEGKLRGVVTAGH